MSMEPALDAPCHRRVSGISLWSAALFWASAIGSLALVQDQVKVKVRVKIQVQVKVEVEVKQG
jgi:hypothetical protein